jgi:hypothetical protein
MALHVCIAIDDRSSLRVALGLAELGFEKTCSFLCCQSTVFRKRQVMSSSEGNNKVLHHPDCKRYYLTQKLMDNFDVYLASILSRRAASKLVSPAPIRLVDNLLWF